MDPSAWRATPWRAPEGLPPRGGHVTEDRGEEGRRLRITRGRVAAKRRPVARGHFPEALAACEISASALP